MSVDPTRCLARVVLVLVAAVGALVPLDAAFASHLYVSKTGNDTNSCTNWSAPCLTIQAAVDKAANGNQIDVSAGTYAESVSINNRDSLAINGASGVMLVPPVVPGPSGNTLIRLWSSRNIQVSDLVLKGNGTSDDYGGIAINQCQASSLTRLKVQDMGGGGIVLYRHTAAQIVGSAVRGNRYFGIRVDASSDMVIGSGDTSQSVVIEDNLFQGIRMLGGHLALRGPSLIEGNKMGGDPPHRRDGHPERVRGGHHRREE